MPRVHIKHGKTMPNLSKESSPYFPRFVKSLGFNILMHGHIKLDHRWHDEDITQTSNVLYLVKSGRGEYRYNGKRVNLIPHKAYLFPLNGSTSFSCDRFLEKYYFHFRLEVNPLFDLFELIQLDRHELRIEPGILRTFEKLRSNDIRDLFTLDTALRNIIARFISTSSSLPNKTIALLERHSALLKLVDEHLGVDLNTRKLAALMNHNAAQLQSAFKRDAGMSLKEFIVSMIIRRAKDELLFSDKKIWKIAGDLHFYDQFQFSKFFKARTSFNPKQYREHFLRTKQRL